MNCPKRANLDQNEASVTILQSLFCNQYADLKKSGRDTGKARLNAIILFSAMLLLNAYSLFLLLEFLAPDSQLFRSLERLLKGFGSGRSAGRLIAILFIALFIPLVFVIAGRRRQFEEAIQKFEGLGTEAQKHAGDRGLYYVIASFGIFFAFLLLQVFK